MRYNSYITMLIMNHNDHDNNNLIIRPYHVLLPFDSLAALVNLALMLSWETFTS